MEKGTWEVGAMPCVFLLNCSMKPSRDCCVPFASCSRNTAQTSAHKSLSVNALSLITAMLTLLGLLQHSIACILGQKNSCSPYCPPSAQNRASRFLGESVSSCRVVMHEGSLICMQAGGAGYWQYHSGCCHLARCFPGRSRP